MGSGCHWVGTFCVVKAQQIYKKLFRCCWVYHPFLFLQLCGSFCFPVTWSFLLASLPGLYPSFFFHPGQNHQPTHTSARYMVPTGYWYIFKHIVYTYQRPWQLFIKFYCIYCLFEVSKNNSAVQFLWTLFNTKYSALKIFRFKIEIQGRNWVFCEHYVTKYSWVKNILIEDWDSK